MSEKPYVIVRGASSGVFAGYLEERHGLDVECIRLCEEVEQ